MEIKEYRDLVHEVTKEFNPASAIKEIYAWLKEYSTLNNMNKAVIGISGGKDSTIVAKLLVDGLGKDKVFGLLMPNGVQKDIHDSLSVVHKLGIRYKIVNIEEVYDAFLNVLGKADGLVSYEAKINIAPRIRMTTLYTFGQTHGCRVAGTGNLSERMVGYTTKFGDNASDFNLIGNFTSLEVMRIGEELGLPLSLVYKTPADGLTDMSDEDKLGVTYIEIHNYLRNNAESIEDSRLALIENMVQRSEHKRNIVPMVPYK